MDMDMDMDTAIWAVADADIIMAGAGAVAITTAGAAVAATGTIITTESGLCHLPRTHEIGTTVKGTGRIECDRFLSLLG